MSEERFLTDLLTPFHKIKTFENGNSLYLGSQSAVGGFPDPWNYTRDEFQAVYKRLEKEHIKGVVCCAELYDMYKNDITFLHVPMESNDGFDISTSCMSAWAFMDEWLDKGSVLVHCNAGCHRSATIVVGYIAKREKIPVEQAYQHVKQIRSCVHLDNFIPQLIRLVKEEGW